jgi:hypothetical protein
MILFFDAWMCELNSPQCALMDLFLLSIILLLPPKIYNANSCNGGVITVRSLLLLVIAIRFLEKEECKQYLSLKSVSQFLNDTQMEKRSCGKAKNHTFLIVP